MTQFLLETLLWTGALIALVLVLRRPVTRWLGAQAAYALWLLPVARLFMPPIVLPAWLKPEAPLSTGSGSETIAFGGELDAVNGSAVATSLESAVLPGETYQLAAAAESSFLPSPADLVAALLVIWIIGAAVFLARRFVQYHAMRAELLEGSYSVGQSGNVRLVETSAVDGPVAFGVLDKVVALPLDFMISRDRAARDLAIEHELAHHHGHDLLANICVQPLFALHWFNPLGWVGWRALRRDQEAACDARVLASRPKDDRAKYAGVIAELATAANGNTRLALAAPMACPVLGDKSIIHRLRSISMSDISHRRKLTGRALLVGGALTLPLTASISYATAPAPAAPTAPLAMIAPVPPAPPIAPVPPAPISLQAATQASVSVDAETLADVERELDELDAELERAEEEIERELERAEERAEREIEREERRLEKSERSEEREREIRIIRSNSRNISAEAARQARISIQKVRKDFAENGKMRTELRLALAEAHSRKPKVVVDCKGDSSEIAVHETDDKGQTTIFLCRTAIEKTARDSIGYAREAIERDRSMSAGHKAEALRSIDEALRDLDVSISELNVTT